MASEEAGAGTATAPAGGGNHGVAANESEPGSAPRRHAFSVSTGLRVGVEARRPRGKWASAAVRGIVDENDALIRAGGFDLRGAERQVLVPVPAAELVRCPPEPSAAAPSAARHVVTDVCVANVDTLSAALSLTDACALNFANADTPGGRYRSGGRAQEEDLCRLLPQLYPSLAACDAGTATPFYPLQPGTALVSRGLAAVRRPGSYELCASMGSVTIITAAMPCGIADRRPKGGWMHSEWADTVALRIRAVLYAAMHTGHANVVLGAFGCGAFGNPAGPVAALFRQQLKSPEFRGAFRRVVFAVLDPVGTGNLKPFASELGSAGKWRDRDGARTAAPAVAESGSGSASGSASDSGSGSGSGTGSASFSDSARRKGTT